jgi:hypothetical protein
VKPKPFYEQGYKDKHAQCKEMIIKSENRRTAEKVHRSMISKQGLVLSFSRLHSGEAYKNCRIFAA